MNDNDMLLLETKMTPYLHLSLKKIQYYNYLKKYRTNTNITHNIVKHTFHEL